VAAKAIVAGTSALRRAATAAAATIGSATCTACEPGANASSRGGKAVALCTGALVLKGGTLVVSGPSPFTASKVTSAVVGGTGAYAGARGTLLFEDSSGDFAKVTVTLLP